MSDRTQCPRCKSFSLTAELADEDKTWVADACSECGARWFNDPPLPAELLALNRELSEARRQRDQWKAAFAAKGRSMGAYPITDAAREIGRLGDMLAAALTERDAMSSMIAGHVCVPNATAPSPATTEGRPLRGEEKR